MTRAGTEALSPWRARRNRGGRPPVLEVSPPAGPSAQQAGGWLAASTGWPPDSRSSPEWWLRPPRAESARRVGAVTSSGDASDPHRAALFVDVESDGAACGLSSLNVLTQAFKPPRHWRPRCPDSPPNARSAARLQRPAFADLVSILFVRQPAAPGEDYFRRAVARLRAGMGRRTTVVARRTARRASLTASDVGNASATSGCSATSVVPLRRPAYLPRIPRPREARSYSGRSSSGLRRLRFFIGAALTARGRSG
jgi:hypothetical protein